MLSIIFLCTVERFLTQFSDKPQDGSQYRFGKTKLFFRAGQVAYLERLRSRRQHEASVCVQRHMRGWVCRRWYGRLREATVTVQARARGLLARR